MGQRVGGWEQKVKESLDSIAHQTYDVLIMRTTLTIDDDVLAAAKARSVLEQKSVGEVISDLARQSLVRVRSDSVRSTKTGLPLLPRRPGSRFVTSQDVRRIQDQLDLEEVEQACSFSTPTS